MMDLDETLSSRIKTVFENFEDGNQDHGWALLREKFPEKSRKPIPFWWFSGVAASLLLLLGYFMFFYNANNQPDSVVKSKNKQKVEDHNLTVKDFKPEKINK